VVSLHKPFNMDVSSQGSRLEKTLGNTNKNLVMKKKGFDRSMKSLPELGT